MILVALYLVLSIALDTVSDYLSWKSFQTKYIARSDTSQNKMFVATIPTLGW